MVTEMSGDDDHAEKKAAARSNRAAEGKAGARTPFHTEDRYLGRFEAIVLNYYREHEEWPVPCWLCDEPASFTDTDDDQCLCLGCVRDDERSRGRLLADATVFAAFERVESDPELSASFLSGAFPHVVVARVAIDASNGDVVEIIASRDASGWTYSPRSEGTEFSINEYSSPLMADADLVIQMIGELDAGEGLFTICRQAFNEGMDADEAAYLVSVGSPLYPKVGEHFEAIAASDAEEWAKERADEEEEEEDEEEAKTSEA